MKKKTECNRKAILYWTAWGLLFSLAYSQAPLFTSNQNQYFLKGLANAGWGFLQYDWLVQTADPTPVFSFLLEWTYRIFQTEAVFYLVYAVALGIYFYCIIGIVSNLMQIKGGWQKGILAFCLLLLHSAALRHALQEFVGEEWRFVLEGGVAGQRILGPVLQPSTTGILLIVSIYLFLNKRTYLATALLPIAATIHPTYLLSAGLLTASYLLINWLEEKQAGKVIRIGGLALALVLPVLIYSLSVFTATDPEIFRRTREQLVEFRIPHHALISEWFNVSVVAALILILLAVYLLRKHKAVWLLAVPFLAGLGLTAVQALTGSHSLALIFPWRVSTWLVPLSTSIIAGFVLQLIFQRWGKKLEDRQKPVMAILWSGAVLLALFGMYSFSKLLDDKQLMPERGLMEYARENGASDQIYLIPTKMQDFRLETGVPVFADFKSIPYLDIEVREWLGRVHETGNFYREATWPETDNCLVLEEYQTNFHITHVVLPVELDFIDCPDWDALYQDENFLIIGFTE